MEYEKKYKDALEKARQLCAYPTSKPFISDLQDLFPELAESEDERIRKFLHHTFTVQYLAKDGLGKWHGEPVSNILAWLEKQKAIDVLDAEEREFADNVNSYRKDMDEFYKKGYDAGREAERQYWLDSVVDFKAKDWYVSKVDGKIHNIYNSVDKVESKFKVGDWVVDNQGRVNQVTSVTDDGYGFALYDGTYVSGCWKDYYHLWTIQDAKDGDVLADNLGVILFKSIRDNNVINYYAYLSGLFAVQKDEQYWGYAVNCTLSPATKEQRERFFVAMHDAGYEWDADKKELKKIEQNMKLTDFESALFTAFSDAWQQYLGGEEVNAAQWAKEHSTELLKEAKQVSTAWSEEDNPYYDDISEILINLIHSETANVNKDVVQRDLDWLKSLKDRVSCEANCTTMWKPSEKQMKALSTINVTGDISYAGQGQELIDLYKNLKKLRGE